MLRWEFAVLLIVVGVNVAGAIIRALRKEAEAEKAEQRPEARERRPARPKPPTDVDLFLERINQRRQEAAARQAARPPRPQPIPGRPAAPNVIGPTPPRARPKAERPASRRAAAAEVVVVELPAQAGVPAQAAARPIMQPRRVPPGAARVAALLRTPLARQTAFILQEVLGKPVSMRPPRAMPARRVPGVVVPKPGDETQ